MIALTKDNQFSALEKIQDRKYHSCIITGYTFDFDYFELIILNHLKKVGIVNIIVLVDHEQIQNILGDLSGNRIPRSDYSLYAIRNSIDGVFHTKMIYCFGETSALLSIGSGNPTSSGFGGNLEIWGTYYFDENTREHKHLFKNAWKYISKFRSQIKGHVLHKLNWIESESFWLKLLVNSEVHKRKNNTVFLDTQEKSILDSFKEFDKNDIKEIIVLSPFYDSKAYVIKALSDYFSNSKIIIYIQPEEVLFPNDFETNNQNVFFNLIEKKDFDKYIHAKLYILKSKDKEFLMYGSANFSRPAMGDNPKNEEVCILETFTDVSIISKLGFIEPDIFDKYENIKDKLIKTGLDDTANNEENTIIRKLILVNADHNKSHLIVNFDLVDNNFAFIGNDIKIVFCNSHGDEIEETEISYSMINLIDLRISIPNNLVPKDNICYLIIKEFDLVISNKIVIHNIVNISSSNPNKGHRKFISLINKLEIGYLRIFDVLKYLDPETLVNPKRRSSKKKDHSDPRNGTSAPLKVKLTSEKIEEMREFEEHDELIDAQEFENHSNNLWKLLDVLKNYISIQERQLKEIQTDTEADDEETENIEDSKGREEQKQDDNEIKLSEYEQIKKYLNKYFQQYSRLLDKQISKQHELNIVDITVYDISLQLLISLANKEVTIKDEINNQIHGKGLIIDIEDCKTSVENSFVVISIELIGKIIILLNNGKEEFIDYDREDEHNEKTKLMYYYSTFLLCIISNLFKNNIEISEMLKSETVRIPINSSFPDEIKNDLSSWLWSIFMSLHFQFIQLQIIIEEETEKHICTILNNSILKESFQDKDIINAYNLFIRIFNRDKKTSSSDIPTLSNARISTYCKELKLFCELSMKKKSSVLYASFPGFKRKPKGLDYNIELNKL